MGLRCRQKATYPRIKRIIQRPLHKRRNTRLLRPSAAGRVEHLDVVLADKGHPADLLDFCHGAISCRGVVGVKVNARYSCQRTG
jgi:hypothetical protein